MQTKEELETIYKMWRMGMPIECRSIEPLTRTWLKIGKFGSAPAERSKLRSYIELGIDDGVKRMEYRVSPVQEEKEVTTTKKS